MATMVLTGRFRSFPSICIATIRIRTYPRAHILQKFHAHCQSLAANGNAGYQREFEELCDNAKEFSCRAGELDANKNKNRYPFILPYDHCRVKLSLLESQPHSDYINASYVPGGCTEHDFICTQAPLPSTMADFWRMVWEQNVQVIIMMTALKESDKVLCNQYWPPERGTGCYGALQVTTMSRHHGPYCYITTIHLRQHGSPTDRHITHYYYPGWPDQGVPKDHTSLSNFTEHVRKLLDDIPRLGPTVVHCSAGIGRSGTFVAILWLMQLCARGIPPDVHLAVRDLRRHRVLMVQNVEQYILVHQCLLHWLAGNTERPKTRNTVVHFQAAQPQTDRQSRRERKKQRRNSGHTHRPESTHSSLQVSHTPQPQHTAWQSLRDSLHAFNPGKLLQRIMPPSSQLTNSQTQL
ncbi:receptor-type tyrosine-protein phosphatase beta isoform X3 [Ictalurus punctatus]|uniref:Tyrosine-protein phosphatase non-receptor type 20 n=1 Tax=Ictalurus punctatus TaxID=7998 RepID=A0A9F7R448_ICTPU|nr:receptor-type tyrosine-protein phosphatase beta isoform X3 [Ictalurus punctatus]